MAIIITKSLAADPSEVSLPKVITFTVSLRDDEAEDESVQHELVLSLAESNDLSFDPIDGDTLTKEKRYDRKIPLKAKVFTFTERVHGKGDGLGAFRVTLDAPGTPGTGCLVTLL
jgi:hypothetical protein